MPPLVLAVCEDDLERDLNFLKAFARAPIDIRVSATKGGTLGSKQARILLGQFEAAAKSGFDVTAFLLHHDADRSSFGARRDEIDDWYRRQLRPSLERDVRLIRCVPDPCTERWLCRGRSLDSRVRGANPAAGCTPWKETWERKFRAAPDAVREVAQEARDSLRGLEDFDAFFADWRAAGLP